MSIVDNAEAAENAKGSTVNEQAVEPDLNQELLGNKFKYRLGAILLLTLYPGWGFLCVYLFDAKEIIVGRFLALLIGILPGLLTYRKKFNYKQAEWVWGLWLLIGQMQMIYLGMTNDFHIVYITGAFSFFVAVSSFISMQLPFIFASVGMLISIPIMGHMYNAPFDKWISVFFQLATIALIIWFSLFTRLKLSFGLIETLKKLKDSEQGRAESAKMAALGTMAGGVAHEINNPLSIIQGKASIVLRMTEQDKYDKAKFSASMEKIIETVTRIGKITKGLLMFSRNGDADPFLKARMDQIIENTIELCREKFKDAKTELVIEALPQVEVDCRETQISQVIFNLLGNGLDAVSTLEEKWVKLSVSQNESSLSIVVTDSGTGIPDKVAAKMMTPFYTTKEVGKGTGLGLSISQGIATSHNGTLTYNNSTGRTQFVLSIPLRHEAVQNPIQSPAIAA
ncbi:MAG: sensor histidine kinase [Pseudobdellovibrionaceae bacterium]